MKTKFSFILAIILFFVSTTIIYIYCNNEIVEKKNEYIYYNTDVRNSCKPALKELFKENSIAVFGSSELSAADDIAYPPSLFKNGNSNFNMILMGRGYMQSLHHAISLGGISDILPNKKVVLILSPQWFTNTHISSEAYASRFSERMYSECMRNDKISYETKQRITARVKELLISDLNQLNRVEKYQKIYVEHSLNLISQTEMRVYDIFMNFREMYLLRKEIHTLENNKNIEDRVSIEDINFDSLMNEAKRMGRQECTNNNFYIYDEYYDTYIRDVQESRKNSAVSDSYTTSPEYDDLRIFLDVCKETGIEPLIINVPVNGRWYDWIGFSKEDREKYYQNIRDICKEYEVQLADFSDKEYEKYFLKDIMHLGWKGWVYLDEAIYKFYQK